MTSIFRSIARRATVTKHLLALQTSYATATATAASTTPAPSADSPTPPPPPSPSWTAFSASTEPKRKKKSLPPSPSPLPKVEQTRPREIPFQDKVANSVHLIGYVHAPVQFETTSDGKYWAATVITQNNPSSDDSKSLPLWIPVIFEGDLAHIAACHLKENDHVHVAGELCASLPHVNANQVQPSVQVMVRNLNFINESIKLKESFKPHKPEQETQFVEESFQTKKQETNFVEKSFQTKKSPTLYKQEQETSKGFNNNDGVKKDWESVLSSWRDLLENPKQWWDYRDNKRNGLINPKHPDFKSKDGNHALWLDRAPQWVSSKLEGLEFDVQLRKIKDSKDSVKKDGDSAFASWKDLIDNPKQWQCYRNEKLNGLVNPKHPDFKHKDGKIALWLNVAPQWVMTKLEGLEFDVPNQKSKQTKRNDDELWKNLVENPDKWWDNRLDKTKETSPDFKHKETSKVLWLSDLPSWAVSKLPPPKGKGRRETQQCWATQVDIGTR
ncbi:hypothetical protein UlMin_005365 [Ulmus minor]